MIVIIIIIIIIIVIVVVVVIIISIIIWTGLVFCFYLCFQVCTFWLPRFPVIVNGCLNLKRHKSGIV